MLFTAVFSSASQVLARPLGFNLAAGDTLLYLAGNSVVDIKFDTVLGVPVVWVGTGGGTSVSTDMGVTWRTFTASEGLNANSISALHIQGDAVWVGMAHSQLFGEDLFPVGDGFNISTDGGPTWDTSSPPQSTGIGFFSSQVFGMLPFDIASDKYGVWSSVFFGGLIRTVDGGQSWISVFPTDAARSDFENKNYLDAGNRFFSVVAGPVGVTGDTSEVYAGSAKGINRFLLIDAKIKLASGPIWSIHDDPNGSHIWIAGGDGISRLSRDPLPLVETYFDSTHPGIPSGIILSSASPLPAAASALTHMGVFEVPGTDTVGAGLTYTLDEGATWTTISDAPFMDTGNGGYDMVWTNGAFFVAAGDSGLQRSVDGITGWQRVYVDTLDTAPGSPRNRVLSVAHIPFSAQLYVGTGDGVYRLTLDGADAVIGWEPALYMNGELTDTVGLTIRALDVFREGNDTIVVAGAHAVANSFRRHASLLSTDAGATWQVANWDLVAWDYTHISDTVFAATNGGLLIMKYTDAPIDDAVGQVFRLTDTLFFSPPFRSIANMGGTMLWLGGESGYAQRIGAGPDSVTFSWNLFHAIPRDSVDKIQLFSFEQESDTSISGNFVIAFHLQDFGGQHTVWASTRPGEPQSVPQTTGVSRSTNDGRTWFVSLPDKITWNISSFAERVWAATSEGLFFTVDAGNTWTPVLIVDAVNSTEFQAGVEILSVAQLDESTVLAGSDDGIARSTDLGATWTITRSFVGVQTPAAGGDAVTVFASPVPYSPVNSGGPLRIHFKPIKTGPVTIEVFDFAMQKVATILDAADRVGLPGLDPFGTNHHVEPWDALNDKGERVATGVYFFRVSMDGTSEWGKLVILP